LPIFIGQLTPLTELFPYFYWAIYTLNKTPPPSIFLLSPIFQSTFFGKTFSPERGKTQNGGEMLSKNWGT